MAAADQARRKIERDLHDGAQQHLVALAVRVKLAEQLLERDPEKARAALDDLESGLEDALQELRDLAHGIYPPLLADSGTPEPHRAARPAGPRCVVTVDAEGLGRYRARGRGRRLLLRAWRRSRTRASTRATGRRSRSALREEDGTLTFVVSDDGVGFDVRGAGMGAGFTNMLDRLGALGGTLRVDSAPGQGTRVTGTVPVQAG